MPFEDDDEDRRRAVALFRKDLLGELDEPGLGRGEISARIAALASQVFELPGGD